MVAPLIMYGAPAAAAIGTGIWYFLKRKKARSGGADPRSMAITKAYGDGKKDGTKDGTADKGKPHNPRPLINYSDDPGLQTQFENGYNDGYEATWVAPTGYSVTLDPDATTPSAGGAKGMSACDYGKSRGRSSGYEDAKDGSGMIYASRLATDASKKRQAESGDPAEYRRCYTEAYEAAQGAYFADKAVSEIMPGVGVSGVGVSGTGDSIVSGVENAVGAVVGTVTDGLVSVAGTVVGTVKGALDYSVAGVTVRDAAHVVGGGVSGFLVAGVPGAVVGSGATGAMQSERVRRMGRVIPTAVAAVAGFLVAGPAGAAVGGLTVVGAMLRHGHAPMSAHQIERARSEIASGKLSTSRAKVLANALEQKGDKHAATAVRAQITAVESHGTGAHGAAHAGHPHPGMLRDRRHPFMRRRMA